LREECRLRVCENKVLRRICEHKREEVTGEWRRLNNEELYALYFSPNIFRKQSNNSSLHRGLVIVVIACWLKKVNSFQRGIYLQESVYNTC
jgi:hypothetical protein